jgi:hypothetical protein
MTRFLAACAALVAATLPASAQTIDPGSAGRVTVPSAQNSGAGIPGMRDTESGPAARSTDTGSNARKENNEAIREQDAAKIPGLPGNKSGPAVHPGSSSVSAQSVGNGLQSIQQKVRHNLQQAGFTDIQIMPSSFLVRAKDSDGNPVMMVINPDSVTAVTEVGGASGTASSPNESSTTQTPNEGSTSGSTAGGGSSSSTGR